MDDEQRRRKNAKRLLWLMLAAALLVLAIVAYTSIDAPPQGLLVPGGPGTSGNPAG